ncbi:hypothetical protein QTP88_001335 [Uroleucon formosanum]
MSRRQFTLDEKIGIIGRLENGEKNSVISKEFGTCSSTISTIWKNKDKLKNMFQTTSLKAKRLRTAQHKGLEEAVLVWFKQQRLLSVPISGPILQTKIDQLAEKMKIENFKCSASWIQRFRQRHNIGFGKISGESSAVNTDICSNWLANVWPSLRAGYCDDEIYNADEAGLFFKLTPDKTLRFKGEKCSGGKLSKDRITVLVAANMTGTDKRKLLVIGKSKSPRCFKGVSSLPVFYENNTKAWMTSAIFEKTLNYWDDELRRKKKKILLLVDNCPAHPSLQHLKFIKLVFLPANTTAVLQPMDQGVIRNIKAHYRNQLVLKMIEDIENQIESKVTVLDAIIMLDKAWRNVTSTGIANCFRHAGFCDVTTDTTQLQADSGLINNIDEDYLQIDDDLITSEIQTDEDIVDNVIANQQVELDNDTDIEELDDEFETVPSISEARAALRTLERFYYTKYEGIDDWQDLSQKIISHEISGPHLDAMQLRLVWTNNCTIDKELEVQISNEAKYWRDILKRIIKIILSLTAGNLALRGNETKQFCEGNFLRTVKLFAEFDPLLRTLHDKKDGHIKYLSPTIQNELIEILSYITKLDQVSIIIRYVTIDYTKHTVCIKESFLRFYTIDHHGAKDYTNLIKNVFSQLGLDISKCRSQEYNGAAVMSGTYSGVQKRIQDIVPNAHFVHCCAHNLNLVICDFAKSSDTVRRFFITVQAVLNFFSSSAPRWALLASG